VSELSAIPVAAAESLYGMAAQLNWLLDKSVCSKSRDSMYYKIYMSVKNIKLSEKLNEVEMILLEKFAAPNIAGTDGFVCGTVIENLMPDTKYYFAVEVWDGLEKSEAKIIAVKTLNAEEMPDIASQCEPDLSAIRSEAAFTAKSFTVDITDDIIKINPVTGEAYAYGEKNKPRDSGLFDGSKVYIQCAKGEKAAFQLIISLTDTGDGVGAQAHGRKDFKIFTEGSFADCVSLYKIWYIQDGDGEEKSWYPEVAVPVSGESFAVPYAENKIPGQKTQAVFVDIDIKENAEAGCHSFDIIIESTESGGDKITVPVLIETARFSIPRSDFIFELNGYSYPPATAGYDLNDERCKEIELSYYRAGFEHYGVVNLLGYSHMGVVKPNYMPKAGIVGGVMRVVDWSVWDDHFSPFLDGSYAEKITGRKIPINHIYLPLHENWPMSLKEYYTVAVPDGTPYPDCINEHNKLSADCYKDFKTGYREGFKSVIKDFIRHFEEKGWNKTEFQFYLNNKHFYKGDPVISKNTADGICWWLLDEPHFRPDWLAIEYFAAILREAQAETNAGKNIKFRGDLSCFNHAFDTLDGTLDTIALGGLYAKHRQDIPKKRRRIFGEAFWPYGGWSDIYENNINSVLWLLDIYAKGYQGILPWNNYGGDRDFEKANNCAVLYPGRRFGMDIALASLRLKAGRKAMELIKYLDAFRRAFGYSERQLRQYIRSFVDLDGENIYSNGGDAGRMAYRDSRNGLERMRLDMLRKLIVRNRM
jgi:hypothetical protein